MLAGIGEAVGTRYDKRIVGNVDNAFKGRHLGGIYFGSYNIANKEQFGIAVVHNVVYLVGRKLVEDRHGDGTIRESSKESHAPMGAVSAT